jgi:tRNA pseudouridine38-40 synthase
MNAAAKLLEGRHDFGAFADRKIATELRKRVQKDGLAPYRDAGKDKRIGEVSELQFLMNHQREGDDYGQLLKYTKMTKFPHASSQNTSTAGREVPGDSRKYPNNIPEDGNSIFTVRDVESIDVIRPTEGNEDGEVQIWIVGKSFLRHQIRNMVGVLKLFGQGLWKESDLRHYMLQGFDGTYKKEKFLKPPTAPAHGLTLWDVKYPQSIWDELDAEKKKNSTGHSGGGGSGDRNGEPIDTRTPEEIRAQVLKGTLTGGPDGDRVIFY